jgi:hypothetical protein
LQHAPHQLRQFALVVRPRVVAQAVLRRDAEAPQPQIFLLAQLLGGVAQQRGYVFHRLAQRRHAHQQRRQFGVQVLPGRGGRHALLRADLRTGHQAHVGVGARRGAARCRQHALRSHRQFVDVADEQRAAAGARQQPGTR